jgi:hypothetical protein
MSFLNNIHMYGDLHTKQSQSSGNPDPMARMRENFKSQAQKQIDAINNVTPAHRKGWYSKRTDGAFSVSLRNGNATMKLKGAATHITVPSSSVAIDFYRAAIDACSAGELDELFWATRRTLKQ